MVSASSSEKVTVSIFIKNKTLEDNTNLTCLIQKENIIIYNELYTNFLKNESILRIFNNITQKLLTNGDYRLKFRNYTTKEN